MTQEAREKAIAELAKKQLAVRGDHVQMVVDILGSMVTRDGRLCVGDGVPAAMIGELRYVLAQAKEVECKCEADKPEE